MFKFIKNLITDRDNKYFIDGYDWAAGVLLRGEETPKSISNYTNSHRRTAFDDGADAAVRKVVMSGVVEDDRID